MAKRIKKGTWATYDGMVGIAFTGEQPGPDGMEVREEFHVVDGTGNTTKVLVMPWSRLKVAKFSEIPRSRVTHLTPEQAKKRFGYQ